MPHAPKRPELNDLVLVGGGHAHVHVLRALALRPVPGLRLTLIARDVETPYSGMLPGFIAGHYARRECHIDLRPLARVAGARLVHDEAIGLDPGRRRIICRNQPEVAYDIVSLDIGSTPQLAAIPGAAEHATPVKPIDRLADRWERIVARVLEGQGPVRFVTVGGGAGGVEVTLAMQHRLCGLLKAKGRDPEAVRFTIVTRRGILASHNPSVQARFRSLLGRRGVAVLENEPVVAVEAGEVRCAGGHRIGFDELIWVTQAGAAAWLSPTGLQLDAGGFVQVDATLRSVSHPDVFAAGDVAASITHPRPKAGVFAVRQGPPLAENLRRSVAGEPLQAFTPQTRFLSLISTGDRSAVASRGGWAAQGVLIWRLKDWIDRRWVGRYQDLSDIPAARSPAQV